MQETDSSKARELIEDALERVYFARLNYLQAVHGNGSSPPYEEAADDLHVAVMNMFMTLYPQTGNPEIEEIWSEATLWTEEGGEVGLDDLTDWVDPRRIEREQKQMRSGQRERVTVDRLEPDKALRAAQALEWVANELGLGLEPDAGGDRPAGGVE